MTLALKAQHDGRTDEALKLTEWTVHCLQDAISVEKLRRILPRGAANRLSPSLPIRTTVTTILDAWRRADPLRELIGSSDSPSNEGNEEATVCIAGERGVPCMTSSEDYRRYAQACLEMVRTAKDKRTRAIFSQMAQVWFRLAEEKANSSNEKD